MTDQDKEKVLYFAVEYTVYVDIMHSQMLPTDEIIEQEEDPDE